MGVCFPAVLHCNCNRCNIPRNCRGKIRDKLQNRKRRISTIAIKRIKKSPWTLQSFNLCQPTAHGPFSRLLRPSGAALGLTFPNASWGSCKPVLSLCSKPSSLASFKGQASPSSPKSITATQLVPTTWELWDSGSSNCKWTVNTFPSRRPFLGDHPCRSCKGLHKANAIRSMQSAMTIQHVQISESNWGKMSQAFHAAQCLPTHPSSCCQAHQQLARSSPSTSPVQNCDSVKVRQIKSTESTTSQLLRITYNFTITFISYFIWIYLN